MKVEVTNGEQHFNPVTIAITLETYKELMCFYELGNSTPKTIREALNDGQGELSRHLTDLEVQNAFKPLYNLLKQYVKI